LKSCNGEPRMDAMVAMRYETRGRTTGSTRTTVREGTVYGVYHEDDGGGAVSGDSDVTIPDSYYEFMVPVASQDSLPVVRDACRHAVEEVRFACDAFDDALGVLSSNDREAVCRAIVVDGFSLGVGSGSSDADGRFVLDACERVLGEAANACAVLEPADATGDDAWDVDVEQMQTDVCDGEMRLPGAGYRAETWDLFPAVMYPPGVNGDDFFDTVFRESVVDAREVFVYPVVSGGASSAETAVLSFRTDPIDPQPDEGYTLEAVISWSCVDTALQHRAVLSWEGDDGYRDSKLCYADDADATAATTTCTMEVAGAPRGTKDVCRVIISPEGVTETLTVVH